MYNLTSRLCAGFFVRLLTSLAATVASHKAYRVVSDAGTVDT
nr:MAG TPA: hypothetical protein [Caudoviricetes sp.]